MAQIKTETNYKLFKFIKANREIVESKIKNLIKSYESGLNLFPYCPILINENFLIIDGQHRFHACKQLILPIHYMIVPDITIIQIAQLNANASRWKVSDFFNCFTKTGNPDYQHLEFFKDRYEIHLGLAICLLMFGAVNTEGGSAAELFKEGKFKINHQIKAEKIMNAVKNYEGITEGGVLKSRHFIRAIQELLTSSSYKHKDVIDRLKAKSCLIKTKTNYKEYIYAIEEQYNKGNSKRYLLYDPNNKTK